ncbi:MAG: hypothetical protein COW08_07540, partial [Ignavibacteriales bacterium CG12_big_fil_rev_8_21_14_0_65_30_8]
LFSGIKNFYLFDAIKSREKIEENVIAFTNSFGKRKSLIIYNNKLDKVKFTLFNSCPKLNNSNKLISKNIAKVLGIKNSSKYFYIYKEFNTNLEFILSGSEVHKNGLSFDLKGYEYRISLDFKEVRDTEGIYKKIYKKLKGNGSDSIKELINKRLELKSL